MFENDDKPWWDNTPDRGYGPSSDNPYSGYGYNDGNGGFTGYGGDGQHKDTADYGGTFPSNGNTDNGWW